MKSEKIKTIVIVALSVLLAMSVFTQVLFCTLLGINSVDSLKRAMLAKDLLAGLESVAPEASVDVPSETPTVPNSSSGDTTAPTVALDSSGIKITFVEVEYDSFWECYKLKFSIENNSNTDVTITSDGETVDGYMVDLDIGFYCEVLAGKKAVAYMMLYDFALEPLGITQPKVVEFSWSVRANDDAFNDLIKTDTLSIRIA
jgi:hypothetical protein